LLVNNYLFHPRKRQLGFQGVVGFGLAAIVSIAIIGPINYNLIKLMPYVNIKLNFWAL